MSWEPGSLTAFYLWYNQVLSLYYNDVIMGVIASQITSLAIVYSTVYSGQDQRKHQSSASLAFVRGIHRGPVNSPHKWRVTQKMFLFDEIIMVWSCWMVNPNTHFRHPIAHQLGRVMGCLCKFKFWSVFNLGHCNVVCNILLFKKIHTSNGTWCIGIKGEMSGTVCVTFTWDIYIYMSCL